MNRPKTYAFVAPVSYDEIPYPLAAPGHLLQKNAGFRTIKPILDQEKCVNCLRCYLLCPEGTVYRDGESLAIDYDFCKGCGICAHECKPRAIEMIPDEGAK